MQRAFRMAAAALIAASLALPAPARGQIEMFVNSSGLTGPHFTPHSTVTFSEVAVDPSTPMYTDFAALGLIFSPGLYMTSGPSSAPGIEGAWLSNVNPLPIGPGIVQSFTISFEPTSAIALAWSNQGDPEPGGVPLFTSFTAVRQETDVAILEPVWHTTGIYVGFHAMPGWEIDQLRVTMSAPQAAWLDNVQLAFATPEPATLGLLAAGLLATLGAAYRRRSLR